MESSCPFSPQDEGPGRLTETPQWVMVACRSARVRSTSGTSARTARRGRAARAAPVPCWPHPFAVKTSAQRRPEASLVESAHGESALRNQRHQCAQEPAASARQKTRRENCAAREGSAHSTNALRLKHATCPWVVFLCLAMDRSRRASSVSSGLCFATFPY